MLGRGDARDGHAAVGVALAVASDVRATDPIGHHAQRAKVHAQRGLVSTAGVGPALVVLHELVKNALPVLTHETHLVFSIVQRVRGEVVPPGVRIGTRRVGIR